MLFVPVARRSAFGPSLRAFDRFFADTVRSTEQQQAASQNTQDEQAYTLSFDVPGVTREQLSIGIEGNVIRIETLPEAQRQYKAAYELPQDIDTEASIAKLENGVLTLTLAKKVPVSNARTIEVK